MRRFTYEQVKQAFEERGYELLSTEYNGCSDKLAYVCPKHREKGVQYIDWAHFNRGQGCKHCGCENKKSGRQKDLGDYNAKELTESKGMEFVKITRENSKLYIYYICPRHRFAGIQRTLLASMRKKKVGCPYCIGWNKTTESFREELFQRNPNILVRGEYIDAATPIECECLIDGEIWYPTPNALLCGQGCPRCGRIASALARTKSNEMFVEQLNSINPDILPLEEYVNVKLHMWIMCKKCGHKWRSTPDGLLQGYRCPECLKRESHDRQAKSNGQFLKELAQVNPMLKPLEPYYNDHTKILTQCLIHDYIWPAAPNKILHRHTGCPKCSMYKNEQKIVRLFDGLGVLTETQKRYDDCRDKNTLPFDVYVPQYNLLIEYQGEQHYIPIRRGSHMTEDDAIAQLCITQEHDRIKSEYCKINNIPLICIPYWEQDNIEDFIHTECEKYGIVLTQQNDYS